MKWIMKLLNPVSHLPKGWYQDLRKTIDEADSIQEVERLQATIEAELRSFWITSKEQAGLRMLHAYCNTRRGQISLLAGYVRTTLKAFNN